MKIYISGGCKNGKSSYAERISVLLSEKGNLLRYYIATMISKDPEDDERILTHQKSRKNFGFITIEIGKNICDIIKQCDKNGCFLLDSATALLSNEMFEKDGSIVMSAYKKTASDMVSIINELDNIIIVSDFIYSDSIHYDEHTEQYKKGLAFIDRKCSEVCDVVIEVCCGNLLIYKGKDKFGEISEKIV